LAHEIVQRHGPLKLLLDWIRVSRLQNRPNWNLGPHQSEDGVLPLRFLQRIPRVLQAVVAESLELAKRNFAGPHSRFGDACCAIIPPSRMSFFQTEQNLLIWLFSHRASHPLWLVQRWIHARAEKPNTVQSQQVPAIWPHHQTAQGTQFSHPRCYR
jgi:hypothetical protein